MDNTNKVYCFDTNSFLKQPNCLEIAKDNQIVIPYKTLEELDRIKMEMNTERGFNARQAVRLMKSLKQQIKFELYINKNSDWNNDDYIVNCAKEHNAIMVSGDFLVTLKCEALSVEYIDLMETGQKDDYKGYVQLYEESDIARLLKDMNENKNVFNLLPNQYVIIMKEVYDDDENKYKWISSEGHKWTGDTYIRVKTKRNDQIESKHFGTFTPRDVFQMCVLDSLKSNKLTTIKGGAGTGKSLVALSYAWSEIEDGSNYDVLICFVNPMASRNSAKLGFYPGTRDEKLLDSAVGSMLASKFGSKSAVEDEIRKGRLQLLPFSDIRGFDTTGMRAIVWFVEAQNLDVDLMKLGVQRIGEDSIGIIDGDYTGQVDSHHYEGSNNGMRRVSEIFRGRTVKGKPVYGEVELPIVYRSGLAQIAEEM